MHDEPRTEEPSAGTLDTIADIERTAPRANDDPLAAGAMVGRYVVLGKVGSGGMGVVYGAYDPELDRKIAIKLLHASSDSDGDAGVRLLREAQAMARLTHPNVVTVHDVGLHDRRVWLAMEFVEGTTLKGWLAARRRSWREVLDVMLAVGRGIAAAHEAELVHRDLKPDNVMVGDDGRVRVMDFGLARTSAQPTADLDPAVRRPHVDALEVQLTAANSFLGTPAYMAPEQFANAAAGPPADQFAFCVALWEALYGERPFGGESLFELGHAVLNGNRRPPVRGRGVPGWLRRAVDRGLAVDPNARWPTMQALVVAVERNRARSGRRVAFAIGLGVLAIVGGGFVLQAAQQAAHARACDRASDAIAEVWNDEASARVRAGLLATNAAYAARAAEEATRWIDARATEWSEVRRRTCLASPRATDDAPTDTCLQAQRNRIAALVDTLAAADAIIAQHAVQVTAGLASITRCEDPRYLTLQATPPPEIESEAAVLDDRLAHAAALAAMGDFAGSLAEAEAAATEADALDWPPLTAMAQLRLGKSLALLSRFGDAEPRLETAVMIATASGRESTAADAARELVELVGLRTGRHVDALRWARLADALLTRAGEPDDGLARADLEITTAGVDHSRGAFDDAQARYERALAIQREVLGEHHPALAEVLNQIGDLHDTRGAFETAIDYHRQALALWEDNLGPEHPVVANALSSIARAQTMLGDYGPAQAAYERALAVRERAFGRDNLAVGATLSDLGSFWYVQHDYDRARPLFERAQTIVEAALGPEHADLASILANLGNVDAEQGRPQQALERQTRALAIRERTFGADHPELGLSHNSIADALQALGDRRAAEQHFRRAIEIWEASLGAEHPFIAYALTGLGEVLIAGERAREAVAVLERAVDLRQSPATHVAERSASRFALARALWAVGSERTRARELAQRVLVDLRDAGDDVGAGEVERWLADRGP